MDEEIGPILSESFEKPAREDFVVFKALELTHSPCHECVINISQQRIQRRRSITSVVPYPTP